MNKRKHKIEPIRETMTLTAAEIDAFSEKLESGLLAAGIERQNRLRVRLSLEEALLRVRDRLGEDTEAKVSMGKRFGKYVVQIDVSGEPFNPLSKNESDLEDLCGTLLISIGISPRYSYSAETNTLRIVLPLPGINPVIKIMLAIMIGVLIGICGLVLISETTISMFTNNVMEPICELWVRILNAMCGPAIFFIVITTMLSVGKINRHGGDSRKLVARYFYLSFIMTGIACLSVVFFFWISPNVSISYGQDKSGALEQIIDFIPKNIFDPFTQSNTPQLLMMAFVIGGAMSVTLQSAHELTRVVTQINDTMLQLIEWISKLVPYFTGILIAFEIWKRQIGVLEDLWYCILLAIVISLISMIVVLCVTSRRSRISPRVLISKLWEPFWLTIRSGSLDAAYGKVEQCNAKLLGLDPSFSGLSFANGLVLYMPVSEIGTIIFILFIAEKFDMVQTPVLYVFGVILSVTLFVASPPVPGVNLLAYVALFNVLGIPGQALIDAMVFDIVFGIFASAANQALLQMELIRQADKMSMLDHDILRRTVT